MVVAGLKQGGGGGGGGGGRVLVLGEIRVVGVKEVSE